MVSLYKITNQRTRETIDLYITTNMNNNNGQSIVVYESPGNNGGVTLNLGRSNTSVAINGKLFATGARTLEDARLIINNTIQRILDWKDAADIVKLTAPITDNLTQLYYIKSFPFSYSSGDGISCSFSLELIEAREANVKQTAVNLVNFEPAQFARELNRLRTTGT
jgi:hypothetical protein